jgi:cysteinyl-tRNA synthetase
VTQVRLWDTRSRAKVALRTPTPGAPLTMYVCGPTVYGRAHIGNARPAVVFDVLFRLLRHIHGPENVRYARNITDIDDKIMAAAAREGVPVEEVARRWEAAYHEDMAALGCLPPDIAPRATEHVPHMIAMIADLVAKGVAYAAQGHVLFSVAADPGYGSLSRRPPEALLAGARVEVAPFKRAAGDFVLWKPSADDQPGWASPWGRGRPGWHIECSAMIAAHLGETIDIHGGGQDLIFPHHENEAAQSRCAHGGAELARVWMHNGFLSMGAEKMSKSLGNVVTARELLDAGWDGEVIRLALLSAHYRQPLEWTETLLEQSKARLDRWYEAKRILLNLGEQHLPDGFEQALANDVDTPATLTVIDAAASDALRARETAGRTGLDEERREAGRLARRVHWAAHVLGLSTMSSTDWRQRSSSGAEILDVTGRIAARRDAKAAKDWAKADAIRAELLAGGIVLEDRPDGTTDWRRA